MERIVSFLSKYLEIHDSKISLSKDEKNLLGEIPKGGHARQVLITDKYRRIKRYKNVHKRTRDANGDV